jgi:hypothetical protein
MLLLCRSQPAPRGHGICPDSPGLEWARQRWPAIMCTFVVYILHNYECQWTYRGQWQAVWAKVSKENPIRRHSHETVPEAVCFAFQQQYRANVSPYLVRVAPDVVALVHLFRHLNILLQELCKDKYIFCTLLALVQNLTHTVLSGK